RVVCQQCFDLSHASCSRHTTLTLICFRDETAEIISSGRREFTLLRGFENDNRPYDRCSPHCCPIRLTGAFRPSCTRGASAPRVGKPLRSFASRRVAVRVRIPNRCVASRNGIHRWHGGHMRSQTITSLIRFARRRLFVPASLTFAAIGLVTFSPA